MIRLYSSAPNTETSNELKHLGKRNIPHYSHPPKDKYHSNLKVKFPSKIHSTDRVLVSHKVRWGTQVLIMRDRL
jgi:hypothetical protein